MNASTTTTIRGVSIFSRQRKRNADFFDIALSPDGIVVQRTGRSDQHMAWERVTEWEIEERPDSVILTLRGEGSVTPLLVQGWTLEDLETVMREVTSRSAGPDGASADAAAAGTGDGVTGDGVTGDEGTGDAGTAAAGTVAADGDARAAPAGPPAAALPSEAPATGPQADRRPGRRFWKPIVTIVLLGLLATAVTVVLLQSAGLINWSFLGPVA